MASQTQGIQQLLTAEKRAAEKVAEARKRNKLFSSFSREQNFRTSYILSSNFIHVFKSYLIALTVSFYQTNSMDNSQWHTIHLFECFLIACICAYTKCFFSHKPKSLLIHSKNN